jgi:hypothetical protein
MRFLKWAFIALLSLSAYADITGIVTPPGGAAILQTSVADPGGGVSIFVGQGSGATTSTGAIGAMAKGFFTCVGYVTCGGEGVGMSGPAANVENTAVGWAAGSHLTTGQFNTFMGVGTARAETTGTNNTIIGVDAMALGTGSNSNSALGVNALHFGGTSDVAMGQAALQGQSGTTNQHNVALGYNTMSAVTSASFNIAIGTSTLALDLSGNDNTIVGYNAGSKITAGDNTCIGWQTCLQITGGHDNTVIGMQTASTTLVSGANNILIGTSSAVDTPAAGTNSWLRIGPAIAGDMTVLTSGALSTCGTTPAINAQANGLNGTITTGTGATACTLTFTTAKSAAPACIVTARSGTPPAYTTSTAALTLSTAAASATYDYMCSGY